MGEAAPAQATAPGFPTVLGSVGSGSMASVSPVSVHSAIVERLRARIELCRRHHSACESRYARGQAEISDREREATLQLLSIVQQGATNRRGKERSTRGGAAHGPDGARANGEQKNRETGDGEPRLATRIALQGSLRRKIEGQPSGYTANQNGHFSVGPGPDFKRLRMETGSLRARACSMDAGQPQSLAGSIALGQVPRRKDPFMMSQGIGNDIFNMTLRDMKKEPIDIQTCSQSSADPAMMVFDFKDEGGGQIDPELQDLFDELTKSVPPLNDLELEKMLKQDDDFGLDLGRPSSAGAVNPCPHLDKPIKTEYSPDYCQAPGSSPQLRPASAGPSFSMANTTLSTSPIGPGQMTHNHVPQTSGSSSRGLPAWPEMSHAEQLKQMAANQQPKQQPNSLLQHQQNQAGGVRNWPSTMSGHPSSFCQEPMSSTGLLSQPRVSSQGTGQSKGLPNCLFKPSGYNPSNPTEIKALSNKPMLHFTPKASTSTTSQQIPHMSGSQSKQTPQQQSTGGQNTQFQLSMQSCLQPKPLRAPLNQHGPGINYKLNQQRQGLAQGPRFSANGCLVTQQQHPSATSAPLINNGKGQRQLSQPQQHSSETEKFNPQDQFNRHLTRPPPDYKQAQHSNLYPGLTSSTMASNSSDQREIQSISCHIPNGQGIKMTPNSGDRMFPNRSDHSEVQSCAGQLPNSQMQIGMHQNKSQFQGIPPNKQHVRTNASQDPTLGQGLGCMTATGSRETAMSWENVTKQLDVKRLPGTVPPQSAQTDAHFPPRHNGPPNQVVPHSGLIPLNPGIRGSAPRATLPCIPPLPGITRLNQPSPTQQGCMNTYGGTAQSPGAYQNNRAGRLTFDFLQDGDNTVPGINADSEFIDSLLKSGSGSDDWMKDINLEEILGGQS
ncbi:mastermind-like protein 2 [Tachysurus vachellii]|uniref:mastermind-like protein 2 n=1 Tax=Tachysurus vachellii TaxID=175792 RepID=UPI00296AEE7D|nr:mastermind-like protein 2 [Tachysurus vachellii]